jgi:hypothetical protein
MHGAGQLVGGAMTANFGAGGQGYAYVDLTTRFGGTDYAASLNVDINNARITSSAGTNVTGFFTGSNASRAALVYSTPIGARARFPARPSSANQPGFAPVNDPARHAPHHTNIPEKSP